MRSLIALALLIAALVPARAEYGIGPNAGPSDLNKPIPSQLVLTFAVGKIPPQNGHPWGHHMTVVETRVDDGKSAKEANSIGIKACQEQYEYDIKQAGFKGVILETECHVFIRVWGGSNTCGYYSNYTWASGNVDVMFGLTPKAVTNGFKATLAKKSMGRPFNSDGSYGAPIRDQISWMSLPPTGQCNLK
jgi:hypothetical protein